MSIQFSDPKQAVSGGRSMCARSEPEFDLILFTSGRWPYLALTTASLFFTLPRPARVVVLDTSPDGAKPRMLRWIEGFDAPVDHLWLPHSRHQPALEVLWGVVSGERPALHVEEDFVFLRRVPIGGMLELLAQRGPAQVLLQRQRWYAREYACEGLDEWIRSRHVAHEDEEALWIKSFFSLNPCLYRPSVLAGLLAEGLEWSEAPEYDLGQALSSRPWSSAMLPRGAVPHVLHIGVVSTVMLRRARPSRFARASTYLRYHTTRKLWHLRRICGSWLRACDYR